MTASLIDLSRRELAHYDNKRDVYERRTRVQNLAKTGHTQRQIAVITGMDKRQVHRELTAPPPPQRPRLYSSAVSDKRVRQLEETADLALNLAAILRDEDPTLIWGTLTRLGHRRLQELAVIALAAIPVDQTRDQLLGWVSQLSESEGS